MVKGTPMKKKNFGQKLFALFSSYGLASVVLMFLTLLTWLGTLEQVEFGLYEVQKKYFDSLYLIHWIDIPKPGEGFIHVGIPLPGVYLLLAILFVNMLCGAIIRARKGLRNIGTLIAHFSMLLLIFAGWVSFHYKTEGFMRLYEGEESNVYRSYNDWSIEVAKRGDGIKEDILVISDDEFEHLKSAESRTFFSGDLPFEIRVSNYMRNSVLTQKTEGETAVDGFMLEPAAVDKEVERNIGGVIVELLGESVATGQKGILWGAAGNPHTVTTADGDSYTLKMAKLGRVVPFNVRLDKFTRELHPGTSMAKVFSSDITKSEGAREETLKIAMNEPLRDRGYTFFQASWGPENAAPGERLYSVFSVVKNPSDYWPLYACILAGLGLLIHFLIKLSSFISRSNRQKVVS